jgi:hypothetical protein
MPPKPFKRVHLAKGAQKPFDPRLAAYHVVSGFTRIPVAPDGNCFYTATGFFCGLNATEMRALLMKYFLYKKAEYAIFFETEKEFLKAVKENSSPRIWNSELCDIAPHAAAQVLRRDICIHNSVGGTIIEVHTPVEGDAQLYPPLHLFRSNDHYEILLDNSKTPNKNVWPLPDVSEFDGVVDLSFSDSEDDSDVEVVSDDEPTEECLIRF